MKSIIKLIPSFLTLTNLICGFGALLSDNLQISIFLIVFSLLFDVFDGWAARSLNAQSDLGKELDSLADMVSFGIVPAFLYAKSGPFETTYMNMVFAALIVAGSAWRLAKFNLLPPSKYFTGLPTPASAIFMLGILYALDQGNVLVTNIVKSPLGFTLIPLFLCFIMNSKLKMFSLKSFSKNWSENKGHILLAIITIALLVISPVLAASGSVLTFILISLAVKQG